MDIPAKAAAEGMVSGRPSEDTIMVLEDTLSVMKGMEFFGKVTKPYNNAKNVSDALNGKYCTLPVKMVFKDKDSKVRAEAVHSSGRRASYSVPPRTLPTCGS